MGHQSGAVELDWGALASTGGLTPLPAVVDAAWEASPTCTNYCHGGKWATNVAYRGDLTAPSWLDGPAASACGACHRFPPVSLAHQSVGPATSCDNCHPGYRCTTGNPGACVVRQDRHLDGAMKMTDGFCVGCHGDVRELAAGTLGAREDPARLEASPPLDTSGASSSRAVGRHLAHVDPAGQGPQVAVPLRCAECHGLAVETFSTSHADGVRQVTFADATRARLGGVAAGFTPGVGAAPGTCITYCHGAGFVPPQRGSISTWAFGGATPVGCGSCHASPPGDTAHASLPRPATPDTCNPCHAGTVDAAGKIVFTGTGTAATTLHLDGLVQATAPATATCTSCHGSGLNAAPPFDTTGRTSGVAVGAHQRHLAPTLTSPAYQCNACHPVQTSQSHSNGVVDLVWGALARSGAVVPTPSSLGPTTVPTRWTWEATPTCTNYCHGAQWAGNYNYAGTTVGTVRWTDGAAARGCDACHRSPPISSAHAPVTSTTNCNLCHPGYDCVSSNLAACKVNAPYHIGGRLDCGGLPCGP
jgi:predicted CxxxxCH...CXXCH cytochrome family protein